MAGLLGFLAAGAVKGAGDGIVAEARARREAAIAELEHSRLVGREQADRDFRSREAAIDRDFRASEAAKGRAASAEENRLSRMDTITAEDGTTMIRDGDSVRPLKGEDGKPVKVMGTSKDSKTADISTAEWLIKNGVAADPAEAFRMVRSAREGQTTAADIEKMVETAVKTDIGDSFTPPDPAEVDALRTRHRERLMKNLGLTAEEGAGSAPSAAKVVRPKGVSDDQIIEQAKAAISQGADASAVRSRLTTLGIDPKEAGL